VRHGCSTNPVKGGGGGGGGGGVRCRASGAVEQPCIVAPLGPVNKPSIVMDDHLYNYLLQHTREHLRRTHDATATELATHDAREGSKASRDARIGISAP